MPPTCVCACVRARAFAGSLQWSGVALRSAWRSQSWRAGCVSNPVKRRVFWGQNSVVGVRSQAPFVMRNGNILKIQGTSFSVFTVPRVLASPPHLTSAVGFPGPPWADFTLGPQLLFSQPATVTEVF